jgi:hypothetical protein
LVYFESCPTSGWTGAAFIAAGVSLVLSGAARSTWALGGSDMDYNQGIWVNLIYCKK